METTAQVSNVPGQSRAVRNRIAAYAKMAWSEAQQKTSHLRIHTTTQDMGGAQIKFFDTVEKREYTERKGGIQKTVATEQKASKRGLVIKQYELATQTDISDIVDASIDVLEVAKMETTKAQGRLIDEILLDAVISDSLESQDGATDGTTAIISATISTNNRRKNPLYVSDTSETSTATAPTAFSSATLDDIRLVFSKREIETSLCCTLTPELENILRKDRDFQNAENMFSAAIGGDPFRAGLMASQRHFRFKGFNMVLTYEGRLPILSTANIGGTARGANTTRASRVTAAALGLNKPNTAAAADWYSASASNRTVAATGNALTGANAGLARVTLKSDEVIHFWAPEALYFAERQSLIFNRESEIPLFSYAKQVYSRVAFGAMVIDDQYILSCALKAAVITAVS